MLSDSCFKFRGRPAAICAAFGAATAMALGGAMAAGAAVASAATNVAQFHMLNDEDSTTAAEAAKYQIVQLQYSSTVKTLVDQIHANDPGVIVLMYSDPTVGGTGGSTDGWTTCTTSSQDAGNNAWYLSDAGSLISGKMNMGNASYDTACVNGAMARAKSADFDGVFWDEINPVPGFAISQTCINAYQGSSCSLYSGNGNYSAWQNNTAVLLNDIGAADTADSMKSIINDGSGTSAQWQAWGSIPGITGQMEESFVGSYLGTSVPYSQWQTEISNEQWSEAHNSYEMAVHYDPKQNQESLDTFGLASMLLAANGLTSYDSTVTTLNLASYDWWPEYAAAQSLGAPSGAYTTVTSGGATVYERKFAGGIVVVNPTTSASASVSLGGTYSGTGNEPSSVTTVTLPAQSGLILTGPPSSGSPTSTPPSAGSSTPTTSPSAPSGAGGSSGSGSSSGGGSGKGGGQAVPVSLPKQRSLPRLSCKTNVDRKKLTLTCTTKGRSKLSTSLRLRAYHRGHLIAKHATKVRHHRATFGVKLSKHRVGRYRLVVSIHAGGRVGTLTHSVRIR